MKTYAIAYTSVLIFIFRNKLLIIFWIGNAKIIPPSFYSEKLNGIDNGMQSSYAASWKNEGANNRA